MEVTNSQQNQKRLSRYHISWIWAVLSLPFTYATPYLPHDTAPNSKVNLSEMRYILKSLCRFNVVIFPLPSLREAVNKLMVCLELKNYGITFFFLKKKIKQKKNRILNFHEELLEKVVITLGLL